MGNKPISAPVICIPHGGGPMGIFGDPSHAQIVRSFQTRVRKVLRLGTPAQPRAIVIVTAHWSTDQPTISSARHHELYYDYYGFPPETYQLKYDAPGSPEVAEEVAQALRAVGLSPKMDEERGWDHGTFIPLIILHPKADIPIIQLSILTSEDPRQHFLIGHALSTLRSSNVAIIGSGFASLHNTRYIISGMATKPSFKVRHQEWNKVLSDAVSEANSDQREKKLDNWRHFPHAYEMHPRGGAEHFLPLLVAAGAAGDGTCKKFSDEFMGFTAWTYYWAED